MARLIGAGFDKVLLAAALAMAGVYGVLAFGGGREPVRGAGGVVKTELARPHPQRGPGPVGRPAVAEWVRPVPEFDVGAWAASYRPEITAVKIPAPPPPPRIVWVLPTLKMEAIEAGPEGVRLRWRVKGPELEEGIYETATGRVEIRRDSITGLVVERRGRDREWQVIGSVEGENEFFDPEAGFAETFEYRLRGIGSGSGEVVATEPQPVKVPSRWRVWVWRVFPKVGDREPFAAVFVEKYVRGTGWLGPERWNLRPGDRIGVDVRIDELGRRHENPVRKGVNWDTGLRIVEIRPHPEDRVVVEGPEGRKVLPRGDRRGPGKEVPRREIREE